MLWDQCQHSLGHDREGSEMKAPVEPQAIRDPRRGVNWATALKPLRRLQLDEGDPVREAAEATVRRCTTHQSAVGYCYAIRSDLEWFLHRGIHPFAVGPDDVQRFWNDLGS